MPKKTLTGKVTKIIDDKTIKVKVERFVNHKKYNKRVQRSSNYLVDTSSDIKVELDDTVNIEESRPISKSKSFRLVEVQK